MQRRKSWLQQVQHLVGVVQRQQRGVTRASLLPAQAIAASPRGGASARAHRPALNLPATNTHATTNSLRIVRVASKARKCQ